MQFSVNFNLTSEVHGTDKEYQQSKKVLHQIKVDPELGVHWAKRVIIHERKGFLLLDAY